MTWPGIEEDIAKLVSACPTCQLLKAKPPRTSELGSTAASHPLQSLFIDHNGPLKPSKSGFNFILVLIDRFLGWTIIEPTKSTSAEEAAQKIIDSWISIFGIPESITADSGSAFTSKIFKSCCQLLETKLHIALPGNHEGVGAVENMNRTVNKLLRSVLIDGTFTDWVDGVKLVQCRVRCR